MIHLRREIRSVSDTVVREIAGRDAALWIGAGLDTTPGQVNRLRALVQLPWRLVLSEPKSRTLTEALESGQEETGSFRSHRGFLHLISSDPEGLELPQRSLPIYLLNGRESSSDPAESPTIGRNAGLRRRLNMIQRLEAAKPRLLVVLAHDGSPIDDVFDLWLGEFRTLLTVVSDDDRDAERLDHWVAAHGGVVEQCRMSLEDLVADLAPRVWGQLTEDRCVVRLQIDADRMIDLDVTECELVQQPLLDKYELIQSRDLRMLLPEELPQGEFQAFFDKSKRTWIPYAAGLPWRRNEDTSKRVLGALRTLLDSQDENNPLLIIASESGAGGTTLARMIAFDAASQGFPTLVARDMSFRPDFTDIESFLYRIRREILRRFWNPEAGSRDVQGEDEAAEPFEVPWLIVFDVEHWRGRESELRVFARDLARRGRPAVVLVVTSPRVHEELRVGGRPPIAVLTHEMSMEDAHDLGEHLNRFLAPYGRAKSAAEWLGFWENHRPYMNTDIAAFWIALEFWLKRHLDLGASIQSWLYRQFKEGRPQGDGGSASSGPGLSDDLRKLVLEIAALSIERMPLPEGLMPSPPADQFPYSVQLEDVRTCLPALALVRESSSSTRQWALAHDLLGRYLITSVFEDREMLDRLGYKEAKDTTDLRLGLLRRIATNPQLARKPYLPLALEFATNIFKIDETGNLDFMPYWREVLGILEDMPKLIWDTSRTFNQHVAVSRRRVVALDQFFHLTPEEKVQQLEFAIEHLEFALNEVKPSLDDERDLNLLNSLSLAYQNLADVERARGCPPERLHELRSHAADAARRAQQNSPSNSFVLETVARNLLQDCALDSDRSVENASEALGYIHQALSLDTSEIRYNSLMRLASNAVQMLQTPRAMVQIERLCRADNPLGFMAKAFLVLASDTPDLSAQSLERLPRFKLEAALAVLDGAKDKANSLVLKFRYDLVCLCRRSAFDEQLDLLDQLEGAAHQLPPQLLLERAILLHQRNRHTHAIKEYKTLRHLLQTNDVYVFVPERLRWLLTPDGKQQRVVDARVADQIGYNSKAKARVKELQNALIPFVPQDFGRKIIRVGEVFKCAISFGAMGPFIRPPQIGGGRE